MTAHGHEDPGFSVAVGGVQDGRVRITAAGELDLAVAADFADLVRARLRESPVLLDLGELEFMDSAGIRVLDALLKDCEREGWTLRICAAFTDPVRQILDMTGMMGVLPIEARDRS